LSAETISDVIFLREADFVCAIPAMPQKGFDLPTRLVAEISKLTGISDITESFSLSGKEKSLKECTLDEKWDAWSSSNIEYTGPDLKGKKVILIDDKYQSGVTIQYFGMILQTGGCAEIHGLCMVKTLRDTDNFDVTDA